MYYTYSRNLYDEFKKAKKRKGNLLGIKKPTRSLAMLYKFPPALVFFSFSVLHFIPKKKFSHITLYLLYTHTRARARDATTKRTRAAASKILRSLSLLDFRLSLFLFIFLFIVLVVSSSLAHIHIFIKFLLCPDQN